MSTATPTSKAVILVGGPSKGTRMRPLSMDIPKPLLPIAGRPIIYHGIQALSKCEGLKEVLLIGFYEDSVFAHFVKEVSRDFPNLSIRYLREFMSLGTAGGLYHFRDTILKGNPSQIFVLHADIACAFPLGEIKAFHDKHRGVGTVMGVKVPAETANKFGCIVTDPVTFQARHYVEKPEEFISSTINGGVYLFDKSIFDEIRSAMDNRIRQNAEDPTQTQDDQLRLEQDVIAPLASSNKLYVYQSTSPWIQIKSPASAIPANALVLATYKENNPSLLRRRSPTVTPIAHAQTVNSVKGPEIIEPCYIDETAVVDPSAKIGPNVSIGPGVQVGYGVRIKDSIVLDNTVLERNSCVLNAIVSEDCKLGPWARVEGSPSALGSEKQTIAILAKDVTVLREVHVRSCIVLPHKTLSKNSKDEVLL